MEAKKIRYPIGIQTFDKIIEEKYLYVDKTELIYRLTRGYGCYFLQRQRPFGKSLLISTIDAYFRGKKSLFEGLAIYNLEKAWLEYPVLHMDLTGAYHRPDSLLETLNYTLTRWEDEYGVKPRTDSPELRFRELIRAAYRKTGRRVVILVDECFKPVIDTVGNAKQCEEFRETLDAFYSVTKAQGEFIRFAFFTSVSRVVNGSPFSGFNNLVDISMDYEWNNLCGVDAKELKLYFSESVRELAAAAGMGEDECYRKLSEYYGGYHFSAGSEETYDPSSLLRVFKEKAFHSHWSAVSMTPFLAKLMKKESVNLASLPGLRCRESALVLLDPQCIDYKSLLYQNGYLTLNGYDDRFRKYTLDYPNICVKIGFLNFLLDYYLPEGSHVFWVWGSDLCMGEIGRFMGNVKRVFADHAYKNTETCLMEFRNAMYIIFELVGRHAKVEWIERDKRLNLFVDAAGYRYLLDIEFDSSVDEALASIENVAPSFAGESDNVFRIAMNFSPASGCIDSWRAK